MTKRTCLAAWTPPGADMPKYINATLVDVRGPAVEVTVRSPKDLGSATAVCQMPEKQFRVFVRDLLNAYAETRYRMVGSGTPDLDRVAVLRQVEKILAEPDVDPEEED